MCQFTSLLTEHFDLPRLGYFPIGQTKKKHQYLYSNRRKFPNFREFHVIQSKKIRFNFSLYFQSYSLYSNFLRTLALCHSFFTHPSNYSSLGQPFQKNSSSFQADKSPASLIRKFPSLCFRYLCFSCGVKTPKTTK